MVESIPHSIQLANHLAAFRLRQVPPEVVAQAKLMLLDTLGAMLAASNPKYSATRILVDFAARLGGRPESSLVNQRAKTSCVNASIVEVTTADGRKLSHRVDHQRGTRENPLTAEEIHQKYLKLATTVTTAAHAERIAEAVRRIDRARDVTMLVDLLRRLQPATRRRPAGRGGGKAESPKPARQEDRRKRG